MKVGTTTVVYCPNQTLDSGRALVEPEIGDVASQPKSHDGRDLIKK